MPDESDLLMSTTEAGRRLGITTRAVYDLIEAGQLRGAVRTEHGVKIPVGDVEERLEDLAAELAVATAENDTVSLEQARQDLLGDEA